MKVYLPNKRSGLFRMHIQPGAEHKDVSEWKDETGAPIYMTIPFVDGVAKVEENVGKYLIDKQLVKKTPLILPAEMQYAGA